MAGHIGSLSDVFQKDFLLSVTILNLHIPKLIFIYDGLVRQFYDCGKRKKKTHYCFRFFFGWINYGNQDIPKDDFHRHLDKCFFGSLIFSISLFRDVFVDCFRASYINLGKRKRRNQFS